MDIDTQVGAPRARGQLILYGSTGEKISPPIASASPSGIT